MIRAATGSVLLCAALALVGATGGCGTPDAGCIPGATFACTCADGRAGTEVCDADGRLAPCACAGPAVDGGPSDGGTAADGGPADGGAAADGGAFDAGVADGGPEDGGAPYPDVSDAIAYRDDLSAHPGCTTDGLDDAPAAIPGFPCAARTWPAELDPSKPVVLLVHGNSDSPACWEAYDSHGLCGFPWPTEGEPRLAEDLAAAGFEVLALDLRTDLVDEPALNNETQNAAKNVDHGWAVPLAQRFVRSAMEARPDRRFVLVGFSLGVTVLRDALRRLFVNDGFDPFPRIDRAIYLAGANHGVVGWYLCGLNTTMRGKVVCELGDRDDYTPTPFLTPLNGPDGAYETPCADGDTAFGRPGACGGHAIAYTTIVLRDLAGGVPRDGFVSEASAALEGAENLTLETTDYDESHYYYCGTFRYHYGAARSDAALALIEARLGL